MKQINLKASNVARSSSSNSSVSLFLGLVILFASIVSYALVHYNLTSVKNKIEETEALIARKKTQMKNDKYTELFMFEDKLLDIKGKLALRGSQMTNLELIALKTLPETIYGSISCKVDETGTSAYAAKLSVNDMDMLSRQAKSYQSGENFAKVSPVSSSLNEQGKIAADFTFDIINQEEDKKNTSSSAAPAQNVPVPAQ